MKEKCKQFNANALERLLVYLYECRQAVRSNLCEFKFQKFFQRKSCTIGCILPLLVMGVLLTGNIGIVRAQDFSSKSPSGHKLYYTILTGGKVAVVRNDKYRNYTGRVAIPSYVTYKGEKYKVTTIGDACFDQCKFTAIYIPATIEKIEFRAFSECFDMTDAYYGGTLEDWIKSDGLVMYGSFRDGYNLYVEGYKKVEEVIIPPSVTYVRARAFWDCNINSVVFHEYVYEIGEYAFFGCDRLTKIEFKSPHTRIGESAFSFTGLESVQVPSKLEYLGSEAFSHCERLRQVDLGTNMKIIGERAFEYSALDSIELPETMENIRENAFKDCKNLKVVVNKSQNLKIERGSERYGRVAEYAYVVIEKAKEDPKENLAMRKVERETGESQEDQDTTIVKENLENGVQVVGVKHFGVMKTDSTGSSQMIIDTVFDEVRIFEGETGEYYQCKYRSYVHSSARRYLPGDVVEFYNAEGELITRDYDDLLTRDYFPYDGVRQYGKDKGLPEVEAAADIACGMYYEGKSQRREAYQSYMKAYKVCPSLTMAKEKADGILQSMKEEQNQIRRQIQVEHEIAAAEFSAAMNSLSASLQGLADAVGSFSTSSTSRTSTTTAKPGSTANPQPKSGSTAKPTAPKPQKKCTYCNGTGESIEHTNAPGLVQEDKWCDKCRKVVHWWHSHQRCPICKGKGYKN